MYRGKALLAALGLGGLVASTLNPALAAQQALPARSSVLTVAASRPTRASLHVDMSPADVWVGQAVPITVRATFRDVEGVTLEGTPELKSDAIFTVSLPRQPQQATEIVDGQPALVATWKGTITPSAAGPLGLSITLPVSIRYRDAPVELAPAEPEEDPFDAFNVDPTDPSSINRLFQSFEHSFARGFAQPTAALHEESRTLTVRTRGVDVLALPSSGQPAGFSGAVGKFSLSATASSATARAGEAITLTFAVKGDGDLDRVELAGIAPNADFKTYPTSSKTEPAVPGRRRAEKRFEQVLIPLHGGKLTIPSVELPFFDPTLGRYGTLTTAPLSLEVTGAPVAALPAASSPVAASGAVTPAETHASPAAPVSSVSSVRALVPGPKTLAVLCASLLAIALGSVVVRLRRRRNPERSLRRTLRRSAMRGSPAAFFAAARRLITLHFATRWGVSEDEVTADVLRARLGATAEPLVVAISTADALRFGRRELPASPLAELRASIETSIKDSDAAAA